MTINDKQDALIEEFSEFEEWMDKYENIIDYGKDLKGLEDSEKNEENLVRGCQSNVWLTAKEEDGKLVFNADSDAIITKGITILFQPLSINPAVTTTIHKNEIDNSNANSVVNRTDSNSR